MGVDQHSMRDPRTQYRQPDEQQGHRLPHPGPTDQMPEKPDHGEHSYRGSGRLTGRHALITGGDSGIGRAVAIAYAREGADVLISYLPDEEDDAQETARWIRDAGRTAVTAPGDLRDERQCAAVVDRALDGLGALDILVNNAAYQMAQPGGILDVTTEQFDRVLKTNLYAMFWLCRAAVPHLQPGSAIVNTSSIQAYQSSAPLLDYATSKGGVVAFTKALAEDLADRGVRVNSVAPGPIWTPLIPATMPADKVASFGANTPLGRAGQPAEVAPAYVFLASQEASYITGEVLGVTGGRPLP